MNSATEHPSAADYEVGARAGYRHGIHVIAVKAAEVVITERGVNLRQIPRGPMR